jgi:hypothetical protein
MFDHQMGINFKGAFFYNWKVSANIEWLGINY